MPMSARLPVDQGEEGVGVRADGIDMRGLYLFKERCYDHETFAKMRQFGLDDMRLTVQSLARSPGEPKKINFYK